MPCLDVHPPVDLLVIMLVTNDLKTRFQLPAEDIARGVSELLEMAIKTGFGPDSSAPKVLVIAPLVIDAKPENRAQFIIGALLSRKLANLYVAYAKQYGVHFLDAVQYIKSSKVDGIHMDATEHAVLRQKVAETVNIILG